MHGHQTRHLNLITDASITPCMLLRCDVSISFPFWKVDIIIILWKIKEWNACNPVEIRGANPIISTVGYHYMRKDA